MDKLARLIGMDPLEFRFINAYRDGDMKAHRQETTGAALIECMQEAARVSDTTAFFNISGPGEPGRLVEMGPTAKIFTTPEDERTEAYITGRFG